MGKDSGKEASKTSMPISLPFIHIEKHSEFNL